jgi:4-hydroxybutyryl-CoA dehydratase/vinylacetyl-CoA-Delta-isomerase
MKTGQQYLDSLRDGRFSFFDGRRVDDVMAEPIIERSAREIAATYDRYYSPEPGAVNPLMLPSKSVEELRQSTDERNRADLLTSITFQTLQGLKTTSTRMPPALQEYRERIDAFTSLALIDDLRMTECITDAKGNRSQHPAQQQDPDSYVHVADRQQSGIVITGAKLHITGASLCHTLMVMPTKAMKPNEGEYAVACAVDANAPGVHIVNVTPVPRVDDDRHFPVSRRGRIPTCLVVFDNVFVPYERVFLDGQTEYATVFAHTLGLWTRLGSTLGMAEEIDLLVGLAQLIAEANGTARVPHIKEKIAEMIITATLVRAGAEAAVLHAEVLSDGSVIPNELYTNAAKYHGAANYNLMLRHLHDIAGGSVITSPSMADFDNAELHDYLEKYWSTGSEVGGEYRLRLFHAIRDLTADTYGGWQMVTHLHGGGGLFAQQLVSTKHYDMGHARELALRSAGLME